MVEGRRGYGASGRRRRQARWALLIWVVLAAVVAWVATHGRAGSAEGPPAEGAPLISAGGLRKASARLGQTIYWAGPISGHTLVLKELGEGGVQVLYPPVGGSSTNGTAGVLTIGTYPMPDPAAALAGIARRANAEAFRAKPGRAVVVSREAPNSAYFASPDNRDEVEVYSPSPRRALRLAESAQVRPVD